MHVHIIEVLVGFVGIWQHIATLLLASQLASSSREFFHSNALICFPDAARVAIGIRIQTLPSAEPNAEHPEAVTMLVVLVGSLSLSAS